MEMIFTIFAFTGIIILLIGFAIGFTDANPDGFFAIGACSLIFVLPVFICVHNHVDNISTIENGQLIVSIKEDAIKDINEQLSKLNVSNTAILNADTPVKSLIEAKTKFVSELVMAKENIALAKIELERRRLGIMSGVFWYIDFKGTVTLSND